ncbi:MAG: ATP-binding cassette domain-containing protein [Candidatus Rokuibacteriota bacterium]|nr:MAG: ATP-binding cassette domain-containing protein [Candidatus Rokubacteria bacterium]
MLLSPLVVPGVAAGLGFLILAAGLGLLRSRSVLVAAHVALVLPFVVRSVAAAAGALRRAALRRRRVAERVRRVALHQQPRHRDPAGGDVHLRRQLHGPDDRRAVVAVHRRHVPRRLARRPLPEPGSRVPPALTPTVVELRGCTRDYGPVRAVDALDLAVHEGEFLALLGPSGCGKTTTLNLIAGFVPPTAGRILIDGADVTGRPPHLRGLGVVFQSYALFPHLSVRENVAFGLRERRLPAAEIERRVGDAIELVRLDRAGRQRPAELSGGMQQRVALARALVYQPRVLLLDEPLAALDRKLREGMRDELRAIQRSVGITTIFVTHDQAEALGLSDRIAVMHRGRIEQLGAPREIYEHPATRFVADFVGASTVLRGRAVAADRVAVAGSTLVVTSVRPLAVGTDVELAIRPERVRLSTGPGDNVLEARIEGLVYQGAQTEVTARLSDGQRVLASVGEPAPARLAAGQTARLHLPPDAFMVLVGDP